MQVIHGSQPFDGDYIVAIGLHGKHQAGPDGLRFLLISGAPIDEPVAWHGPIVMNTQDELQQAMKELRNGTFIKPVH